MNKELTLNKKQEFAVSELRQKHSDAENYTIGIEPENDTALIQIFDKADEKKYCYWIQPDGKYKKTLLVPVPDKAESEDSLKEKRFQDFTRELEALSKKYGVILSSVGGVKICDTEDIGHIDIKYSDDHTSGDLDILDCRIKNECIF